MRFLALPERKIISSEKVSGCFVSNRYSVFNPICPILIDHIGLKTDVNGHIVFMFFVEQLVFGRNFDKTEDHIYSLRCTKLNKCMYK